MTEQHRTTSNHGTDRNHGGDRPKPILVRGWVRHFDSKKGFGFAQSNDLPQSQDGNGAILPASSIYFNQKQCRVVEGTFDEPTLTRRPTETYVSSYGRDPDNLVMLVVPSDRPGRFGETSYRAIAWGLVKPDHWTVSAIKTSWLSRFNGSEVALTRISERGRRPVELWRGLVEQLELNSEFIKLRVRGADEVHEVKYDLKDSRFSTRPEWGGEAVINLWVDDDMRRLVFH